MKDLKKNIQKNNMKKLLLSAVLGMFCYCTNNATEEAAPEAANTEENKEINKVLTLMLVSQIGINKTKKNIEPYAKKINIEIKGEGTITKQKVLNFIKSKFTDEEQNEEKFQDDINKIEQYFHLENKKDGDECNKDNLTEIFWDNGEGVEIIEIPDDLVEKIKAYFKAIIDAENAISEAFKKYYEAKKEASKEASKEKLYDNILKEIINECCSEGGEGDGSVTKFIGKLEKIELTGVNSEEKKLVLEIIGRRITLSDEKEKKETDFINFLKQKIGEEKVEEKKKENNTGSGAGSGKSSSDKQAVDDVCSCCKDCCKKK